MKVELTVDQCESLADFIDVYLLTAIRENSEIDNLQWVWNLINAKNTLEEACKRGETALDHVEKNDGNGTYVNEGILQTTPWSVPSIPGYEQTMTAIAPRKADESEITAF